MATGSGNTPPAEQEQFTDDFMIYHFKVTPCDKTYRHNWRTCPFAHKNETARRRDHQMIKYHAVICHHAKQKEPCPQGENCPCAHNVFEYWLLPSRFKTDMCMHGNKESCKRKFCFFAHHESELRTPPDEARVEEAVLENTGSLKPKELNNVVTFVNGGEHWPLSDIMEVWDAEPPQLSNDPATLHTQQQQQQNIGHSSHVFPQELLPAGLLSPDDNIDRRHSSGSLQSRGSSGRRMPGMPGVGTDEGMRGGGVAGFTDIHGVGEGMYGAEDRVVVGQPPQGLRLTSSQILRVGQQQGELMGQPGGQRSGGGGGAGAGGAQQRETDSEGEALPSAEILRSLTISKGLGLDRP
ncbi:hypothetical protein BSKO_05386 [Bryopsis sp. KO-2023]|nr:hypothetical protein BSKO_05386 [Bryopsis sp. KO-2023]